MSNKGVTIIEIITAIAVTSIIILVIAALLSITYKSSIDISHNISAQEYVTRSMRTVEKRLMHINEILIASATQVMFIADINTWPDYNEDADADGDGIPNYRDADVDGDATDFAVSAEDAWQVGYNLKDDDDDDDDYIDMRWHIYIDGKNIMSDYSFNEEYWGNNVTLLLTGVVNTQIFTYFGSTEKLLSIGGSGIDTNSDGTITVLEMDVAGNGNGSLDLQSERDYIVTIRPHFEIDINKDGEIDFASGTEVLPPLLYLKRRP